MRHFTNDKRALVAVAQRAVQEEAYATSLRFSYFVRDLGLAPRADVTGLCGVKTRVRVEGHKLRVAAHDPKLALVEFSSGSGSQWCPVCVAYQREMWTTNEARAERRKQVAVRRLRQGLQASKSRR